MTGQLYIQSVIDHVPHGFPLRNHIALELQSHIAERVEQGHPLDEILRQLGDPLTLAESYLAAVPLESAGIARRVVAKLIDVSTIVGAVATSCVDAVVCGAGGSAILPSGRRHPRVRRRIRRVRGRHRIPLRLDARQVRDEPRRRA
jgi:hypothetical protein